MMAVWQIGFKASVIIITIYLLSQSTEAFAPIIISFISAFILHPVARALSKVRIYPSKRRLGMTGGILCSFIIAAIIGFFLICILLTPLIEEFSKLYKNIPHILTGIYLLLVEFENNVLLPLAHSGLYQQQSDQLITVLQQAITSSLSFSFNVLKNIANVSVQFISRMIGLIVVPVLTFYFIKDWRYIIEAFLTLFTKSHRIKVRLIINEMGRVISDFLRGQFLLCLIISICMFTGLSVLKIDYPLVLALFAGIAEAIPVVGPVLSSVPVIILGLIASPALGVKVAIFCFFLQQIENHIIVPKVMGGSINLHPVSVIISILIAGQFLGILGMIAALPTIALVRVLMKHFWITEERI